MPGIKLRKRHRLRNKEIDRFSTALTELFSIPVFTKSQTVDMANAGEYDVIIVDNAILALFFEGKTFLTLRGIKKYQPASRFATVDMGAVKFIYNGADVMAPGIVDADPALEPGDLVWIRDETHGQPLAIGKALMSGGEMKASTSGKAIKTLHFVGDPLWQLDE